MQFFDQAITFFQQLDILTVWAICLGVLLLCGFGLPIPEDITLVLCGYMTYLKAPAQHGAKYVAAAVVVGLLGVLVGDGTMFTLGLKFGTRLVTKWPFRAILGGGRLEKTKEFLSSHGPKVLFTARFTPGLRSVVFFSSGTLGIRFRTFLFYDGLAALLSVPALVLSSWYWGEQIEQVIEKARKAEHGILIVILIVAALLVGKYLWGKRRKTTEI